MTRRRKRKRTKRRMSKKSSKITKPLLNQPYQEYYFTTRHDNYTSQKSPLLCSLVPQKSWALKFCRAPCGILVKVMQILKQCPPEDIFCITLPKKSTISRSLLFLPKPHNRQLKIFLKEKGGVLSYYGSTQLHTFFSASWLESFQTLRILLPRVWSTFMPVAVIFFMTFSKRL